MALFGRIGGTAALPCTRLALGATQFIALPARDDRASILSFFASSKDKVGTFIVYTYREPDVSYTIADGVTEKHWCG